MADAEERSRMARAAPRRPRVASATHMRATRPAAFCHAEAVHHALVEMPRAPAMSSAASVWIAKAARLAGEEDLERAFAVFAPQGLREEHEGDDAQEPPGELEDAREAVLREGLRRGKALLAAPRARRGRAAGGLRVGEDEDDGQDADGRHGAQDAQHHAAAPELVPLRGQGAPHGLPSPVMVRTVSSRSPDCGRSSRSTTPAPMAALLSAPAQAWGAWTSTAPSRSSAS